MTKSAEWAVRLNSNTMTTTGIKQPAPVFEGVELHLIDRRRDLCSVEQHLKLSSVEVGDADRAGVTTRSCIFHSWPGPGGSVFRPVHEVKIDVLESEPLKASFEFVGWIVSLWIELGSDPELVARHSGLSYRPSDTFLVTVGLCGIEVPIAELKSPAHGVERLVSVG